MAKKTVTVPSGPSFADIRDEAIIAYKKIYKDSLAFDLARVSKEDRLKLLEDPTYIAETKAIKAELYAKQLKILNDAINGEFSDPDKSSASEILKALEMRNKLLFNDLNIEADESDALNIVFMSMDRKSYEELETATLSLSSSGQSNTDDITFEVDEA
jgi:hypothetical protein